MTFYKWVVAPLGLFLLLHFGFFNDDEPTPPQPTLTPAQIAEHRVERIRYQDQPAPERYIIDPWVHGHYP